METYNKKMTSCGLVRLEKIIKKIKKCKALILFFRRLSQPINLQNIILNIR